MTRRQDIIELLSKQSMTLRELVELFHVDSKEILSDLQHIEQTIKKKFVMEPSECKQCGFVYKDRSKHKRPSKCPKCKGEKISEPVFLIKS